MIFSQLSAVFSDQKDALIEMTFMMIRRGFEGTPDRGRIDFRQFAQSTTISSRRNIDVGVLICLARRKVNSSNPRFGGDEFAGLNYHKKAGCVSVHAGICATIEMPAFFCSVQLFRRARPTKPITRFARKTKLRMTAA